MIVNVKVHKPSFLHISKLYANQQKLFTSAIVGLNRFFLLDAVCETLFTYLNRT